MGPSFHLRMVSLMAVALVGCASESSRIGDYLAGFQPAYSETRPVRLPITVGLLVVLPENELSYPTTPSKDMLTQIAFRIQKELQESSRIKVAHISPAIIVPATGIGSLSVESMHEAMKGRGEDNVIVVVATSKPARKVYYGMIEDQLFARMDAALVDLRSGVVLATESGQDDYVLAQSYFFNAFSYPRLYYRTFTFAGPFTVVDGNPYKALGVAAFSGAADQIGMKLRQRLDPQPSVS